MDDFNTPSRPESALVLREISEKERVTMAFEDAGIENCGLILGIDYTMSNIMQGKQTFGGRSLHSISVDKLNPYEECIFYLGETFEGLNDDSDDVIHAFGFGDEIVKDKDVFPLKTQGECHGFIEVLEAYTEITPNVELSGPSNFAPLIYQALSIVRQTKKYHILVIIADGQVDNEQETFDAIVEASNYPLSIIMIGVGDGPWITKECHVVKMSSRNFDNFQFVDFDATISKPALSLAALREIKIQYTHIRKLCLLQKI